MHALFIYFTEQLFVFISLLPDDGGSGSGSSTLILETLAKTYPTKKIVYSVGNYKHFFE